MEVNFNLKKVFVDIYLAFNLGDDLFLDLLARKYPNSKITLNHLGNNYDKFIANYKNVNKRKYSTVNKIRQHLKLSDYINSFDKVAEEHDVLIFIGGSIFREEKYHSSLYPERLKLLNEFKRRNKPIVILGANFGPFETDEFLNDYKQFFMLCDDVCFRDLNSYNLFKELPQVRYSPDIIFQMPVNEYKMVQTKEIIGYSIIDVRHKHNLENYYKEYIFSTVKSIELMVGKGYECCLMSFCKNEGDLEIIETILSYLSQSSLSKVFIYDYNGELKEAINIIASFKMFISARFHANILALILGVGVMPIIYSDKTSNMLKDIHFDKILVNMDELNKQYDETTIDMAYENKGNLAAVSKKAINQFKVLDKILESSTCEKNNEILVNGGRP